MTAFTDTLITVARSHDRNGEPRTASLLREASVRLLNAQQELSRLRRREPLHCPSCECGEHILGPLPTGEAK